MSGSSSEDDKATFEDDRFQSFVDDSVSDDSDVEQPETSSAEDNDQTEPIDDDDDDDDDEMNDEDEFNRPSSFPAPMPWPPALVLGQNEEPDVGSARKKKHGIIYLSSIPPGFNVAKTISFFSKFGKIGRVFLQPDLKEKNNRRDKMARNFTEGWVEFLSKRVAKDIAANLNNSQVGGSKRSKSHDVIWNIKYLPRFKWTHLSERLAYERASHTQKMRTEVSQAKREADFFRTNVDRSKRNLKRSAEDQSGRMYHFRQKEPESEVLKSQKIEKATSSKKEERKTKDRTNERSPVAVGKSKTKSQSKNRERKSADAEPPSKKSRTRSSDRKDFLQNIFGTKN